MTCIVSHALFGVPFTGSSPGTMAEVAFAPPAGTASTTTQLVPAPQFIVRSSTDTLIVQIEASGAKVAGTGTMVNRPHRTHSTCLKSTRREICGSCSST